MGQLIFRALAWPIFISLNLLACLLVLIIAVLGSDYGTQQAFAAASRWLPLQYDSVKGNALNQLQLNGLHYEDDSIALQLDSLNWSIQLAQLWQAEPLIQIQSLAISDSHITIKQNAASNTESQAEPFQLQAIRLPLGLQINDLSLRNITLRQQGQNYSLDALNASASISRDGQLKLSAKLVNGPYNSQANFSASAQMTDTELTAKVAIQQAQAVWENETLNSSGNGLLRYNGETLKLSANNLQAQCGNASLKLDGTLGAQDSLSFEAEIPSLKLLNKELGGDLALSGSIENAEQLQLQASAHNISWLGEPQLEKLELNWQGDLAEQTLVARLYSQHWAQHSSAEKTASGSKERAQQALILNSRFGWRGDLSALLAASALPAEDLLAQPALHFQGSAELAAAEIAASGVSLRNNRVSLQVTDAGRLRVSGHSESGEGHLALEGEVLIVNSRQQNISATAQLSGQQYQLAKTPELQLSASPKLSIQLSDQMLSLRGDINIDKGHIELILPEAGAVTASSDVVIIDDPASVAEGDSALKRDIQLQLLIDNPITIKGQGFDGSASGRLTISERNGQLPQARGELNLAGRYKAYGQDLSIRRGKLIYVDSPIDDPGVDLEAIRSVNQQIAGVRVSGLASQPNITIFSEPALSETEALSYLVLGRGLDKNSEADQNQLRNLALSLGLSKGGKFLEKSKDKLGVDELSIQTGNNNNDASLLVGRQLSKRLYLSTQIGLFEPVSKLLLRYSLNRKCDLVAETGSQQGADVVCTISSD